MQDEPRLGARVLDTLMRGVSTRDSRDGGHGECVQVQREPADDRSVGSQGRSPVRAALRGSEVGDYLHRRDGVRQAHHGRRPRGVDPEGHKHVLALREGATENHTVAEELLEGLVMRGGMRNRSGCL
jgi:hypothetical protein